MGGRYFYRDRSCFIPKSAAAIQRQSEIDDEIRALYLSGVPLFTKEQLYAVRQQLKALKGGRGKVLVAGVNGQVAEFAVKTGDILPTNADVERIMYVQTHLGPSNLPSGEPRLLYRAIQELTSTPQTTLFAPAIAYCSLHICQISSYRSRRTKQQTVDPKASGPCLSETMMARHDLKAALDEWEKSKQREALIPILRSIDLSSVKRAVAFACGSMESRPGRERLALRATYQHGLLLTICKVLSEEQSSGGAREVSAWAQDPAYCAADGAFLAECGISTLDDPDGFLKVDESTMVLSFAPDAPVKQIVADISRPAAMIWDRVAEHESINRMW
jgi:hypothetical protein